MKDLVDEEGENLAVRAFLNSYGYGSTSVTSMMLHMKRSGYPLWPDWVETKEARGHLTKAGAQLWLRYLFELEKK